jgi:hypothetical protein
MPRKSIVLLLIALAVSLVGCGEEDGGDASAVEAAIVTASKSNDPADCERLYTQDFLERMAYGQEGEPAVEFCEELARTEYGTPPKEVTVSSVGIDDREATAEVSFVGSSLDGQAIVFALVEEEGRWKVDRMVEFLEFDRARLLDGLRQEVSEGLPGVQDEVGACVIAGMETLGDDELQDMALYRDPRVGTRIIEGCVREAGNRQTL